jgi:hypothetical protein
MAHPKQASWIHGTVFVPESAADGKFAQVASIPFTNRVGFPRGDGKIFRGQPGSDNWFHASIPTPVLVDGVRVRAEKVFVLFRSDPGARIENVHVWDGSQRKIFEDNILRLTGNFSATIGGSNSWIIPGSPEMQWGLGLSVRVNFLQDAHITFTSAGADFVWTQFN